MTQPNADWDRLGRYVAGELSPAEAGEVQRWLAENAKDDKALAALALATSNLPASQPVDVEAALRKVKARLAAKEPTRSWGQLVAWAAAAAVVIAVGLKFGRANTEAAASAAKEYATSVGARDSILLADGSRVILGPASRIVVKGRDVELSTGEAYFAVTHDAQRPFTVRVGGTLIRDIGTEFSVHSDRENEVRVVVREGSVQLTRDASSVTLAKGDVGMLTEGGQVSASRGTATPDDLAWTSGRLVFRDAPMIEVSADLRRWYGVELKVTDTALLRKHFTGEFTNASLASVMERVALALPARADRRGDTVFIRPVASPK